MEIKVGIMMDGKFYMKGDFINVKTTGIEHNEFYENAEIVFINEECVSIKVENHSVFIDWEYIVNIY